MHNGLIWIIFPIAYPPPLSPRIIFMSVLYENRIYIKNMFTSQYLIDIVLLTRIKMFLPCSKTSKKNNKKKSKSGYLFSMWIQFTTKIFLKLLYVKPKMYVTNMKINVKKCKWNVEAPKYFMLILVW